MRAAKRAWADDDGGDRGAESRDSQDSQDSRDSQNSQDSQNSLAEFRSEVRAACMEIDDDAELNARVLALCEKYSSLQIGGAVRFS